MKNLLVINLMGQSHAISPYLLFNGIGLIVGLIFLENILRKKFPESQHKAYIIFVFSIVGGWIAAHFFDCLINKRTLFHGGFTFYGGLGGGVVTFLILSIKFLNKKSVIPILNAAVPSFVLAHAIGRIGCYFSGCCNGVPLQNRTFFSYFFKNHPTQLYESFFLFLLSYYLFNFSKTKQQGSPIKIYLFCYGLFRFFVEFLRENRNEIFYGFNLSQGISIIIVLIVSVLWLQDILAKRAESRTNTFMVGDFK
jgi:phosphatidylglycerol:prolipoprotein diacylglycerol transferase